ncbi:MULTISPECIES: class II glutamine amidotransferase [unclassified Corallococcus]|uniref:class II glutamine amidotransferase n=1 Tax=unclassified Corallococcus TaxID=2685029 RepID=UPI001A8E7A34|nr:MULTISPECIES: class II glutamine amidotransferase [unclassified Corallococcus]MBN9684096.1 class II glutamine amidotransferase [Corallococcus sp. NCSPR001]WAS84412.1 class II glutamine amidotransferase [Corallococcus sp. NCRR]
MSAILAALSSDPNLLRCELHRLTGQVVLRPDAHANALGVGSYAQEEVLLRRLAPDRDLTLDDLGPPHESEAVLFHANRLPLGLSPEENTQPFRVRHWLFAHQGPLPDFEPLRAPLLSRVPEHLRRLVRGPTDSEVLFALFLTHLRELGRTDDPRLGPAVAGRVLRDTVREVEAALVQVGQRRMPPLNMVATNGTVLAATRRGESPLYYTRLEGSAECAHCGVTPATPETHPEVGAHRRRRTVVVASHVTRTQGWVELPQGTTLTVGADLQVQHLPAS